MAFWDGTDLDIFFADFGIACDLGPAFDPQEITVLFENEYEVQDLGTGQVASRVPLMQAKTADIVGLKRGDALWIEETEYSVQDIRPDGTGLTTVILSKV